MEIIKDPAIASSVPVETEVKGKAEKKGGKRIGYYYIIIKSLKESQKNDVVKCLYIKGLTNFGFCVIKEGTYGDSKDREGRDIKDRLVWQKQLHQQLQDKIRMPRYLGEFEENGNYYLVMERIKGKPLYNVLKENNRKIREGLITGNKTGLTFLDYLEQLTHLLESLHENHIVHRDASATNFMITPSGKVTIIDMELSYSLSQQFPSPPFQLGTYGYMSPQQEGFQPPSIKDDIFSVGAIMLQVWTGISPYKLTNLTVEEFSSKVYFLVPDRGFADIILQCMHPDPEQRPTLARVREVIQEFRSDLQLKKKRLQSTPAIYQKEQLTNTIQQVIHTLASPLLADEKRGWFAEDSDKPPHQDKKKINKAWYTSFNKGAFGVFYVLSKAKQVGFDTTASSPHVIKALELVESKYMDRINDVSPSLHYGSSGIAGVLATAIREKLIEPQAAYFNWIEQLAGVGNEDLDFSSGIAGQGIAQWLCNPFLNEDQMQKRLTGYVSRIIQSQQKDGSWIEESGKKKQATKGFARGVAGIAYFLLEYALQYQEREAMGSAKLALKWLMKTSVYQKGSRQWRSSEKKTISPWWAEGAPGIAMAFMKAYSLLGDVKYKNYATEALLSNPKNILDNNLSQYNGLTGLGEIYLEAYQLLKDSVWLDRAGWIAEVIMQMKRDHKDHGPYWIVAHESQPTPVFMNGNSGVLHFLLRYCYYEQIPFPLLNA